MRTRFRFFLLSLLLTALAAGSSAAYRISTVQEPSGETAVLQAKHRPADPAHLAVAVAIASPAQQSPRGFMPPGELPAAAAPMLAFYKAPVLHSAGSSETYCKSYLTHNYPFHAFW